jgi:hypothetical protein
VGAGIAVLGFAIGGLLTERGVLDFLILGVAQPTFSLPDAASLPALLGMRTAWFIVATVVAIGFLLWLLPKPSPSTGTWAWHKTGLALAALGILAWLAGFPSGWHWGLSMTGPSRSLLTAVSNQAWHPMTWGAFMLLGVPLGSLLSAWRKKTAGWQMPDAREFPRRFLGGLLMGFGGTLAGGCNIGNALTGLSILSVNSLLATAAIVLGLALAMRVQGVYGARLS